MSQLRNSTLVALVVGVLAAPALTACSQESPVAPQPRAAGVPAGPNTTGFTVGWGVTDTANTNGVTGTGGTRGTKDTAVVAKPMIRRPMR